MPDLIEAEFGEDPTCLYRLYDREGTLLYIGITFHPKSRMEHHAREQTWWDQVSRRTMVWYPDRQTADTAETAAIGAERPKHNKSKSATDSRPQVKRQPKRTAPKRPMPTPRAIPGPGTKCLTSDLECVKTGHHGCPGGTGIGYPCMRLQLAEASRAESA